MYESIRIQNFRGLKDLTIENLGRVNLLVGANNVGKTSVLEAIWLLNGFGNPNLGTATATYRGVEERLNPIDVWRGLVLGAEIRSAEAKITGTRATDGSEAVTIRFNPGPSSGTAAAAPDAAVFVNERPNDFGSLSFERTNGSAESAVTTAQIALSNLGFTQSLTPTVGRPALMISPVRWLGSRDLAVSFTLVDDTGYREVVERAVRQLEPRIERLSLGLSGNEETPTIRAHMEGQRIALPIYLLGAGTGRLIHILLGLALHADGVALIDEIDMGVYYDALESYWRSVNTGLDATGTQLFATTHSWECVTASVEAFRASPGDFRLHRISRRGQDLHVVTYDHELALAATTGLVEVR